MAELGSPSTHLEGDSDVATGVGTLEDQDQEQDEANLSDVSDTGWDTDLEIEGNRYP